MVLQEYLEACCSSDCNAAGAEGDASITPMVDAMTLRRQLAQDLLRGRRMQNLPKPRPQRSQSSPPHHASHASSSSTSQAPRHSRLLVEDESSVPAASSSEGRLLIQNDPPISPGSTGGVAGTYLGISSREQRSRRIKALCEEGWLRIGGCGRGYIDMRQNEAGLAFVLGQLGDIPVPEGYWYVQVFQNFDTQGHGQLCFDSFREIAEQWDAHCQERLSVLELAAASSCTNAEQETNQSDSVSVSIFDNKDDDICSIVDMIREASTLLQDSAQSELAPLGDAANNCQDDVPKQSLGQRTKALAQGENLARRACRQDTNLFNQWQPLRKNDRQSGRLWRSLSPTSNRSGRKSRAAAAEVVPEVMCPTYEGQLAIFDEYEFLGIIGQGACGKVMAVRHKSTQQVRACKIAAVQREAERELIDTEIALLKSLNHPNIMNLHEVYFESVHHDADGESIYLVTELCQGGGLLSRIAYHYEWLKQPMTEGHVAFMMRQILSATLYCHKLGVIHRDIKPQNILFMNKSASSPIKMIDFGLANFTERIRQNARVQEVPRSGALGMLAQMLPAVGGKELIPKHVQKQVMQRAGTPHYMAPELIAGHYNEKADLFSIGTMFCELLTGVHPFFTCGVDDEVSAKAKITARDPVSFPCEALPDHKVSTRARDLCLRLLRKDPRKRLGADQALSHPWFRCNSKATPYGNAEGLSTSIFDGLSSYKAHNKLKRAGLQLLACELSEGQMEEPRGQFMALNTQGDGLLSLQELEAGARHVGYELKRPELMQIMAALDSTGSGRIGYKEFVSALVEGGSGFDEEHLRKCFRKFDTRGTGRITYEDIRTVLCSRDGPGITRSEWEEIVPTGGKPISRNEDEPALTLDAFLHLMQPSKAQQQAASAAAASPAELLEMAADLLSEPGSGRDLGS